MTPDAISKTSRAITDFQQSCQNYFVCYSFAGSGLEKHAKTLASIAEEREKTLWVGTGHPDKGHWHAQMKIGDAIESSQENGVFADKIAKSFITAMYSEWGEFYRHRLAEEAGVNAEDLKCDLMGDMRVIRNCIVHNKSQLADKHTKLKQLDWTLTPGELTVSKAMFSTLIDQINQMEVRQETTDARFGPCPLK